MMKNINKDYDYEVVLDLMREKLGVEPSILRLMVPADEVINIMGNKNVVWGYSILTDDGEIKDVEQLIEYDPERIYLFKSWDKMFIIYSSLNKDGVVFLTNNIYRKLKKNNNGNK